MARQKSVAIPIINLTFLLRRGSLVLFRLSRLLLNVTTSNLLHIHVLHVA